MAGKIIGIAGVAKAGKDTLCEHLIQLYAQQGVSAVRYAFADELKRKLAPFVWDEWQVDIFNCSAEEKELIRPLMVAYGGIYRKLSGGSYWADIILKEIGNDNPEVAIITDVRYAEFDPTDEVYSLLEVGTSLVHVQRQLPTGEWLTPPNEDEERNDPMLQDLSEVLLKWESREDSFGLAREMFEDHSEVFLG